MDSVICAKNDNYILTFSIPEQVHKVIINNNWKISGIFKSYLTQLSSDVVLMNKLRTEYCKDWVSNKRTSIILKPLELELMNKIKEQGKFESYNQLVRSIFVCHSVEFGRKP